MQIPGFVTLNSHRIKVQRWHQEHDVITFTTVIRGEHLGNELVAAMGSGQVNLVVSEDMVLTGSARLLDRHTSGAGPTAVHRLEIQFTIDASSNDTPVLTADQKLDAILTELRLLRREVEMLREPRASSPHGGITPPRGGATLLDFEIPIHDDDPE